MALLMNFFMFTAVDGAKIFVADGQKENSRIYVADLADLQFTELFSEDMDVRDFAFDSVEQKLYWLQRKNNYDYVYCSNVNGSSKTELFETSRGKYENIIYICLLLREDRCVTDCILTVIFILLLL